MAEVNTRAHRATPEPAVIRLAEEHERLHPLPRCRTRCASGRPGRSTGSRRSRSAARSTRSRTTLVDERVWARADGRELIVVHVDWHQGPREVARHG